MKHSSRKPLVTIFIITIFSVFILTQCQDKNKYIITGYTGPLTNPKSVALSQVNHFIEKDSIDKWTERYQLYKDSIKMNHLPGVTGPIFKDSCSFYNTIIRKIIGNENSIGLRMLQGMDAEMKVHTIFVGIKPDYSSLYIDEPEDLNDKGGNGKDGKGTSNLNKGLSPFAQTSGTKTGKSGKVGGAEYGTMP